MDTKKLKILLLEDDHDDAWLISESLKKQNFEFELTVVGTKKMYLKELIESPPEIILSDHYLPTFNSTEALDMLNDLMLNIPFILVTGTISEESAVKSMKNGASDYILKDRLQRLPAAILSVLQKFRSDILQKEAELKIKENEKKYAALIQHLPANIALLDREGKLVDVNNPWKLFATENEFAEDNYGIGSNYSEIARRKQQIYNGEGILISEAIEKIVERKLTNFSMIYPCHSPNKKRWFKAIVSRENEESDSGIVIMHVDVTEQQEAEFKVKQSEANLLSIFNNTDISLILLDLDLNVVSCNKIANIWAAAAWGINVLEGVNLISVLTADKQRFAQNIINLVLTGEPFDNVDSYVMSDGSLYWFRMKMHDVTDKSGLTIGHCIATTDITEEVLARKKLEENERRFQSLIEHSTDMKTLVTQEGKMTYASPAVTKALGYSIEEFINTPVNELIFIEDLPALMEKIQDVMEHEGKSIYSQHRLIHKNGQAVWCEGTITNMFHEPSIQALVSNFRNITERKTLEVLYQKTNRLARLGSWDVDVQNNKLYWSDITREIHEVDVDFEPKLETAINFYKEGVNRDTISALVTEATITGKSWDVELKIITAKQNERWVRAIGEVEIHDGICTRISGSFQDIDSRKIAELERERIANDLLKYIVNLEQFAYIVSHNLRGPVASILGIVDVLQFKISEADRTNCLKHLMDATVQMDQTIKDLNKILQLKSEYSDFKEPISLPDLLTEIESSIQNTIIKEHVKIESNFDNINSITTIKSYIHSIFYNLILNSIKYRKKEVSPIIEIRSDVYEGKLQLIFKDNGKGMDLNLYGSRLFGLYNRFHLDVEGKGLGLFMIKTQIEVLGGSITVKSAPDEGAEFTVELPLQSYK